MDLHVANSVDKSSDHLLSPHTNHDQTMPIDSQNLHQCDDIRNQQSLESHTVRTRASSRLAARVVHPTDVVPTSATPPTLSSNSPLLPAHVVALSDTVILNTDVTGRPSTPSVDNIASSSLPAFNSPVCRIQTTGGGTSTVSTATNASQTGTCPVCRRSGIHVVNTTGLLRNHGPHNNRCNGGRARPLPGTQHPVQNQPILASQSQAAASPASSAAQTDVITHPQMNSQILKRIPKGARPAAANLLQKLIRDVLLHPSSSSHWTKLLGFSSNCLAKPSRGGKSRNLTTQIVKQISEITRQMKPKINQAFSIKKLN